MTGDDAVRRRIALVNERIRAACTEDNQDDWHRIVEEEAERVFGQRPEYLVQHRVGRIPKLVINTRTR